MLGSTSEALAVLLSVRVRRTRQSCSDGADDACCLVAKLTK